VSKPQIAWRESRRSSARAAIVHAAWDAVAEHGLAGLSIRDLAQRAGITSPTIYAYFASKHDIYDAMFGEAAGQFAEFMAELPEGSDANKALADGVHRFAEFCTASVPRYQLLFQRTIPGFEPSPASYEPMVSALDGVRVRLADVGVRSPRHLDMWTALVIGLVDQQISNDPGGERWIRLIDESVEMFLAHSARPVRQPKLKGKR
jgi:AcrR family transcriptional regulator